MSSPTDPGSAGPPRAPLPARAVPVYGPPPRPPGSSAGRIVLALLLIGSIALNIFLICGGFLFRLVSESEAETALREHYLSGTEKATDKIAVIRVTGPIMDSQLGYAHRQIEQAAEDAAVKAVVVRIDSPGGTISASDDLYRRFSELRDGTAPSAKAQSVKRPLLVSMGATAASGGYYIAMPAGASADPKVKRILAERTTVTGSIGVYAAFVNAEELAKKYGVEMDLVKAGAVKGSGSLFFRMTPEERQPWADMVDQAYQQFLSVVETGRPQLKGKLTENLFPPKTIPIHDERGNVVKGDNAQPKTTTYTRQRADGGVFTADDALKWGLIDAIGTLDDTVQEAARQAGLSSYRAVIYEKPITLLGLVTGTEAKAKPDFGRLAEALGPRIWYLVPGTELSAISRALGPE